MSVVIELTLTTRPGHYEQALEAYLDFVNRLEDEIEDLSLAIIAGEPAQDLIHGVGIYESAEAAEDLASLPFFAEVIDALEPHLAKAPERNELELLALYAMDTEIQAPHIGEASLVEMSMLARLGHVDDVIALHESFAQDFQEVEPNAVIILETVQRASGRIRAFVLYENTNIATAEGSGPLVGGFYDAVETLLAEPPRRSELHIVHAFARG